MNYLYAPEFFQKRQSVLSEVATAIGRDSRVEMFPDLVEFAERLHRFNNPEIIVLLAVCEKDMPHILPLVNLLRDASIIVLLSDDEQATMTAAIHLRAKFIGKMNLDLDKIVPIINKLMKK